MVPSMGTLWSPDTNCCNPFNVFKNDESTPNRPSFFFVGLLLFVFSLLTREPKVTPFPPSGVPFQRNLDLFTMTQSTQIFTFENDVNISLADKTAVLKMLRTILQNLADPVKSQDAKYRQLRLSNAKIQNMTRHVVIMSFLQHTVGFQRVTEGQETLLRIPEAPDVSKMKSALVPVAAAYERIHTRTLHHSSSSNTSTGSTMSEKQKARQLAEQRAAKEKEEARLARKRTQQQIKADKYVRENDPNWKPVVNAAAAKTGDSIFTFRDKYGEN